MKGSDIFGDEVNAASRLEGIFETHDDTFSRVAKLQLKDVEMSSSIKAQNNPLLDVQRSNLQEHPGYATLAASKKNLHTPAGSINAVSRT